MGIKQSYFYSLLARYLAVGMVALCYKLNKLSEVCYVWDIYRFPYMLDYKDKILKRIAPMKDSIFTGREISKRKYVYITIYFSQHSAKSNWSANTQKRLHFYILAR